MLDRGAGVPQDEAEKRQGSPAGCAAVLGLVPGGRLQQQAVPSARTGLSGRAPHSGRQRDHCGGGSPTNSTALLEGTAPLYKSVLNQWDGHMIWGSGAPESQHEASISVHLT